LGIGIILLVKYLNRLNLNPKRFLIGLGIGLFILLLADFNSRMSELERLTNERSSVAVRATALMQTQVKLQEALAFATSEAAVENWAYEEGRLVRPGDFPVVPIPVGEITPTTAPDAEPTPITGSNWEIWWAMFFDTSP